MTAEQSAASVTKKADIIATYKVHPTDVGSYEVQVALLTDRIQRLTRHFEAHREDKHSKRGMMALISRRKRLLQHLKREDVARYRALIGSLGLRK